MNHCYLNHSLTRLRPPLVVLAQPAIPPQPPERPLHHPPLGDHLEPLLLVGPLHHAQLPAASLPRPVDQPLLLVDPIDPDHLRLGARSLARDSAGSAPW